MNGNLSDDLLAWYRQHGRRLPWRRTRDPYAIWVSEVMLQQTRVDTVIDYYRRWLRRFPSVADVAAASRQEVLKHWEGLGYYGRAHNLHRGAQWLMKTHAGKLPRRPEELRQIPGVGAYTAAAIAAIAFDQPVVALDGNLRRVLARLYDVEGDVRSTHVQRELRRLAEALLPDGQASAFNQALMDLGAQVCTPRNPDCPNCPLRTACLAYRRGTQATRPQRAARGALPHVVRVSAVVRQDGKVLIGQRPEGRLLGGMWEFPGGEKGPREAIETALQTRLSQSLGVEVNPGEPLGVFEHSYTHYRVTTHAHSCDLVDGEPRARDHTELRWVRVAELGGFPMGKIDRAVANRIIGAHGTSSPEVDEPE